MNRESDYSIEYGADNLRRREPATSADDFVY